MTLRLRLTIAIVGLVAVGLAAFGVATVALYSRLQYENLDDLLRREVGPATAQLQRSAGIEPGPGPAGQPGGGGPGNGPGAGAPRFPTGALQIYAELIDHGEVVATIEPSTSPSPPALPATLAKSPAGTVMTVPSEDGSTEWRVFVGPADRSPETSVVVAVPLTEVATALDRLVLVELVASAGLLAMVGAGSWLILRRGLRPLEQMATSANAICGGSLSERVSPADDRTEVGQLGLALNTMLDEIEEAFREREATERRLRQFLSDASHELRTPLTSIQGFAELFRLGDDEDRDHVNLEIILRRIEEESARMKVLVEDLLLLARLDETRPVNRSEVDLAVLAADACSDAVALDPTRSVTLDAPEPLVMLGDQDHLRQAVTNLVANALGHTPAGTAIEVSARMVGNVAEVAVRDHGPGLDPEAVEHVFDRFWRADDARAGEGAGLGLAIVAAIATEHGGTATATNDEHGGARFTLAFPLDAGRVPPA